MSRPRKYSEELRERAVRLYEESDGRPIAQVARDLGISVEAVHRSASGVGRIRASTQEAILMVAASTNGQG